MTPVDDPEAYLNAFERMATAARWAQTQWAIVLIPCLIGPAQQAVDTLPASDLNDSPKMNATILQMLNLSPKVYRRRLCEIDFGPDFQPHLVGQQIRAAGLRWLRPNTQTKEQTVVSVLAEHYIAILPFKPKNWVLCNEPAILEEAVTLIEAYASAEAGLYFILKSWKHKAELKGQDSRSDWRKNTRKAKPHPGMVTQERAVEGDEDGAIPPLSMQRPHTRSLTSKCFMCGNPGHFQRVCPTWTAHRSNCYVVPR